MVVLERGAIYYERGTPVGGASAFGGGHLELLEELGHTLLLRGHLRRPRVDAEARAHHVEVVTTWFGLRV